MIGYFVKSLSGHDKNKVYVILAEEGDFYYLCDGKLKTIDKPKKKRKKHTQIINSTIDSELIKCIINKENITNEQIKYEIKKYLAN